MRAKQKLLKAIRSLLKERELREITVKQILQRSGVSKSTFYRCFTDKYSLMNQYYAYSAESLLRKIGYIPWANLMYGSLRLLLKNREYYQKAFRVGEQNSFVEFFFEQSVNAWRIGYCRVTGDRECPFEINALIRFYCRGCVDTVSHYLSGEIQMPPEEFIDALVTAMPDKLRRYVEHPGSSA